MEDRGTLTDTAHTSGESILDPGQQGVARGVLVPHDNGSRISLYAVLFRGHLPMSTPLSSRKRFPNRCLAAACSVSSRGTHQMTIFAPAPVVFSAGCLLWRLAGGVTEPRRKGDAP